MTRFEESLLARLKEHTPDPGCALPGRSSRAPVVLAGAAVVATAAVAIPVFAGGGAVAHAVTRQPDGSVAISLRDLVDLDAANRELRGIGVTNVVIVRAQPQSVCVQGDQEQPPLGVFGPPSSRDNLVVVRPDRIPAGDTAVISAQREDPRGFTSVELVVVATKAHSCVEVHLRKRLPLSRSEPPVSPSR